MGNEEVRDLQAVARAYQRANETAKRRRAELHHAIVDSVLGLGMSKSEAARISGYTREYVAKLCDDLPIVVAGDQAPPHRRRPDH